MGSNCLLADRAAIFEVIRGGTMLRADFEEHILWQRLRDTDDVLRRIRELSEPEDIPAIEGIQFITSHYWSFYKQRNRLTSLFTDSMLSSVDQVWTDVANNVNNRLSTGSLSYLTIARSYAENSLLQKAAWPDLRPTRDQVNMDRTLFEELLETQRLSVEALANAHAQLRAEITQMSADVSTKADSTADSLDELLAMGQSIRNDMETQKGRVDEVVANGLREISALQEKNENAYRDWKLAREADFNEAFEPLRRSISDQLDTASDELDELKKVAREYKALSSADAADILAQHYEAEAKWSRVWGGVLYGVGIALLIAGAAPLVIGLSQQPIESTTEVLNWQQITLRIAVGVLAASAATVAIRLGSRLIADAGAVKRMALEFRVIDPFLANVADRENVDTVRVDLVDRTFGRSYIPAVSDKTKDDEEVINVGAVSQLLGAVGKMLNR